MCAGILCPIAKNGIEVRGFGGRRPGLRGGKSSDGGHGASERQNGSPDPSAHDVAHRATTPFARIVIPEYPAILEDYSKASAKAKLSCCLFRARSQSSFPWVSVMGGINPDNEVIAITARTRRGHGVVNPARLSFYLRAAALPAWPCRTVGADRTSPATSCT